ncbi:MAG: glucose/sorbosone dehydrogenase, partial [Pyrinomonadaceae bacterium]
MKTLSIFVLLTVSTLVVAQPRLIPQQIKAKDGRNFTLNAPTEFEIIPAIEGLRRVRFFAKAPDGRIFVTDLYNLTDNKRGTIYILDGWDGQTGKFSRAIPYMTGLRNPNSVQFYRDGQGVDWLYIAETGKL